MGPAMHVMYMTTLGWCGLIIRATMIRCHLILGSAHCRVRESAHHERAFEELESDPSAGNYADVLHRPIEDPKRLESSVANHLQVNMFIAILT